LRIENEKTKGGEINYEFRIATLGIPSRKDVAVQNNIRGITPPLFFIVKC